MVDLVGSAVALSSARQFYSLANYSYTQLCGLEVTTGECCVPVS